MTTKLPGLLAEIATVTNEATAVLIARQVGGTRVYFPARLPARGHWLIDCVGHDVAEKICAHFAVKGKRGQHLDVPIAGAGAYAQLRLTIARRVHELEGKNESAATIARATGITTRSVHRRRAAKRARKSGAQRELF